MTAEPHGFHGYVGVQRRGVQQREREVDEHVDAGQVVVHETGEDFLAHLDDLNASE